MCAEREDEREDKGEKRKEKREEKREKETCKKRDKTREEKRKERTRESNREREKERGEEREEKTPLCVRSKRLRVYGQDVSRVYRQQARMSWTCGPVAGTHGDVLTVHTEAF